MILSTTKNIIFPNCDIIQQCNGNRISNFYGWNQSGWWYQVNTEMISTLNNMIEPPIDEGDAYRGAHKMEDEGIAPNA